jgi:hypothetical protein
MYLKKIFIKNNGAIRTLNLCLPFKEDGNPIPIVFVGENGSGKTNLISIITDALFEAEASYYTDVVSNSGVDGRAWFRLVGASTISKGSTGDCCLLNFVHGENQLYYIEKGGNLPKDTIINIAPAEFKQVINWADDGAHKVFNINDSLAKTIFSDGVYAAFPSSRSEYPYWLNRESVSKNLFEISIKLEKKLNKPIYIENGLGQLKQWMMSVLVDIKADFITVTGEGKIGYQLINGSVSIANKAQPVWEAMNTILRTILADKGARFMGMTRFATWMLGFQQSGSSHGLPLDSLSSGQATLLNVFGTLVRYGDTPANSSNFSLNNITGICLIDEVDAHAHIDLQYRAIPELIRLFPKVQFILSSHSPLFVLGMEKVLGTGNVSIVDMPSGTTIEPESFSQFGEAMSIIQNTKAFNKSVLDAVSSNTGKTTVFLEGETDPLYLNAAIQALGKHTLLSKIDLQWIGSKNNGGQAFNTGNTALTATFNLFKAHPDLIHSHVILLYDNDTNVKDFDSGMLHVRSVNFNSNNTKAKKGIENLLPISVFTADVYDTKNKEDDYGGSCTVKSLNKMKLCKKLCENPQSTVFEGFSPVISTLETILAANEEKKP